MWRSATPALDAPAGRTSADAPIDVSVVVVNYNTGHLIERTLAALQAAQGGLRLQVIVIDNASRDNSVEILRRRSESVELIQNSANIGFARANNQALPRLRGRYVLLLNSDAFVSADTLEKTITFMDAHPHCGVLGVKLIGPDGSLQPSCRYFPTPWNVFLASTGMKRFFPRSRLVDDMSWDHASERECDWVPGCYYLTRREVIDRVGLFDPRFFLYYEEVDHCRAVTRAGWSVMFCPFTQVVHIGGESACSVAQLTRVGRQISKAQIESELLYFRKHHGITGFLAAVALAIVGEVMKVGKSLLMRRDKVGAVADLRHVATILNMMLATRMGSRATH